ncbi:MAG: PEP-CTERM-box response regulator transcription factor [Gammaproteobacteria bacterium]|nr:PEP-CTERM-box response regulator transcription factor [Gammaproteobacteria bacterium]
MNEEITENRKLLIVEDDPGLQSQLRWAFEGYEILLAEDRETALNQVRRYEPSVVTLDLGLPPDPTNASEGLEILEQILAMMPDTKVIVVTGNDERENAVRAISLGAYDYYQKPIDPDILGLVIERAYKLHSLEQENRQLTAGMQRSPLEGIVSVSPQMNDVCRTVETVAPTDATILLQGESGTGKELLARALHRLSERVNRRFVAINCAAIPETLLESELFGYEKGAFTGAVKQTKGKIEYADTGTLFLDEIGDLPQSLQAKLLRFLQERVIERVGGRGEISVDVRVICATHQNLTELMEAGSFREDLYYRISEITLKIPPLRDRAGDAVVLARTFFERYIGKKNRALRGFTDDALTAIEACNWPGNARELENRVKRAVIMANGSKISAVDLELEQVDRESMPLNLRQVRDDAERNAIDRALAMYDGNVSQAADVLGVSRPTMYDLVRKYKLK